MTRVLDHGWVWTLGTALLLVALCWTVEHWERVRRWRPVAALLLAAAIADHLLTGTSSRHDLSTSIDPYPWSLEGAERLLWLVEDVDDPDSYAKGA